MDTFSSLDGESFWSDGQEDVELFLAGEEEEQNMLWQTDTGEGEFEHQSFELDMVLDQFDTSGVDDDTSSVTTDVTDKNDDVFLDPNDTPLKYPIKRKGGQVENKTETPKEKKPRKKRKPRDLSSYNMPFEVSPKIPKEELDKKVQEQLSQTPCPGKFCNKPKGHDLVCNKDLRKEIGIDPSPLGISTVQNDVNIKIDKIEQDTWLDFEKMKQQIEEDFKVMKTEMTASTNKVYKGEIKDRLRTLRRTLDDFEFDIAHALDCSEDTVRDVENNVTTAIDEGRLELESTIKEARNKADMLIYEYKVKVEELGQALAKNISVVANRARKPTDEKLIKDAISGTRFVRKRETKLVLEYIHGGERGSLLGAKDFLFSNASHEFLEEMLKGYRGGRFLKERVEKVTKSYENSEEHMRKAVATIFGNHISRRKYSLMSKLQNLSYDPNTKTWVPRRAELDGVSYRMARSLSFNKVELFVKSLNIGPVYQIPQQMGVSRTITSLSIMIVDLYLRVDHLKDELIWFKDRPYHFIMQFSDDGAPETKELTMSIGTLTCWNLGQKVRSRELQYFLHGLSVPEKAAIMSDIWRQHTNEMKMMEDSEFTVNGIKCTFSFEPSADMAWQSWASNEVGQQATYFSPYGNVCLSNMATMNGSLGPGENDTWNSWTMAMREENVKKLKAYLTSLKELGLTEAVTLLKKREFMAKNGIRQKGMPIIGKYVDQLRPEPLHCEINAWQHCLNLVYREVNRRGVLSRLLIVLSSPITGLTTGNSGSSRIEHDVDEERDENVDGQNADDIDTTVVAASLGRGIHNVDNPAGYKAKNESQTAADRVMKLDSVSGLHQFTEQQIAPERATPIEEVMGCGIPALAKQINEHRRDPARKNQKLHFRLIGPQAIAMARNWHRVCECLKTPDESPRDEAVRLALYRIGLCLREAGSLFQQATTDMDSINKVDQLLREYFQLHVLFFGPKAVTVTVWTMGYALPFHMKKLYEKFKVGYGITSMQSRESENAGIKLDLAHTNRSRSTSGKNGKWWQVCRWNYVRTFYLPEHEPIPSNYRASFESRMPSFAGDSVCKSCGGQLSCGNKCTLCDSSEIKLISESGKMGTIVPSLRRILANVVESDPEAAGLGPLRGGVKKGRIVSRINSDDDGSSSESDMTDVELMSELDDLTTDTEARYHVMDISGDEDWEENSIFDLGDTQLAQVHATEDDFWESIYQNNEADNDFENLGIDGI